MILITIKVLNIGTDRSDPDQTAPNYEQSDQGLHCFVIPPASVYAFTAIKNKSTASGAIYARSSVIFAHRMAFVRREVDAVKTGPKLNLIKKIWGKRGGGWGGG